MQDFKNLSVWEKAHSLSLSIYTDSKCFPDTEKFGITNQLRRACFSIPTNIAEACGRNSSGDFARFLEIARGSASETEYLLLLSRDLGFMNDTTYKSNLSEIHDIQRMLHALITRIKPVRKKTS